MKHKKNQLGKRLQKAPGGFVKEGGWVGIHPLKKTQSGAMGLRGEMGSKAKGKKKTRPLEMGVSFNRQFVLNGSGGAL